jgi:dolichol kinase
MALMILVSWRLGTGSAFFDALARPSDLDDETPRGTILTPLVSTAMGGLVSTIFLGEFAVVGYLVCGWGDAAGEAVGRRWGKRTYTLPLCVRRTDPRTLEGSVGVFITGSLGATVALVFLGFPLTEALGTGVACGLAGAVSEGVASGRTDNFWVQVLPALTAWWTLV